MPASPHWTFVLVDHEGTPIGDLKEAKGRKLKWTRNEAVEVQHSLDIDDPRARDITDELLGQGIPRLRCYQDGELRAHAFWQPHTEEGVAESGSGGGPMNCLWRGPFARYDNALTATSLVEFLATPIGSEPTDPGGFVVGLIKATDASSSKPARLKAGNIETTPSLDRTYEHKKVAEVIRETAEAGFDFDERPIVLPQSSVLLYENQITNGSFESSATTGWSAVGTPTITQDTNEAAVTNGSQSCHIEATGALVTEGQRATGLSVVSGHRYYAAVDVLTSDIATLRVSNGADVTKASLDTSAITPTALPYRLEMEFEADATASDWRMEITVDTVLATAEAWFDSAIFTEIDQQGERPVYFDGDSPNGVWTGTARNSSSQVFVEEADVLAYFDVYEELGSDISDLVYFEFGTGTRQTALSVNRQILNPLNRIRVLGEEGVVVTVEDADSIERYGLYETVVSSEDQTTHEETLRTRGLSLLRPSPLEIITCLPNPETAPQPFADYYLGDTVGIRVREGSLQIDATARINSIEIELDDEGNEITHTLTFDQSEEVVE